MEMKVEMEMEMELEQSFHMQGGDVETSYANHSLLQRSVIAMVRPILEENIAKVYRELLPDCLRVADLGCSSGPNALVVISEIVDIIADTCMELSHSPPCLQAFLNDLYGNDFNAVFVSLPGFHRRLEEGKGRIFGQCYVSAMPGSFYGRLFPDSSLHFFHSSYAVMWLSKVPKGLVSESGEALNKGNLCVAKTSPPAVLRAYLDEYRRDFTFFLKCRAQELVTGGSMVITTMGSIKSDDPLTIWEVIGLNLHDMVLEGLIEAEKLDRFDLPYYTATEEEAREVIEEEGSFSLERFETIKMDWDEHIKRAHSNFDVKERAKITSADIRAVGEPILAAQFGESVMDELFRRFESLVLDHMTARKCQYVDLVMCLTKK